MPKDIESLVAAIRRDQHERDQAPEGDAIHVSETVSMAASVYETVRNTLEYDEEHLLRRNAIRRFLKRRYAQGGHAVVAEELLRELIWAKYLPNKRVPETRIAEVARVLEKYDALFLATVPQKEEKRVRDWLFDALSTEIEYAISPPLADEALASYAYQTLKGRIQWTSSRIKQEDRDLQVYLAVHRAVLKSNPATIRFRALTLFYPDWPVAAPGDGIVREIAGDLPSVIEAVEAQIRHSASDPLFRIIRRNAPVYRVLGDVIRESPDAFMEAIAGGDTGALDKAIAKAADERYAHFRARLRRGVMRAVVFLFLTKLILALAIEWPYERFVLQTTDPLPLIANIVFHPLLLGVVGLTVSIPEKRNTAKIRDRIRGLLGLGEDFQLTYKTRTWVSGKAGVVFSVLYAAAFLFTIGLISALLLALEFNIVSIVFFLFFLSLVLFLGLKLRLSRRELVVVESGGGIIGTVIDILFLPIIRAGRWIALRAPRVNVFLFFFDFIIEAPFKAAITIFEGWQAFLKEKKEEI